MQERMSHIDGHRGLAILLVVLYHAYSRWGGLIKYDSAISNFPVFKFGMAGVWLFFMISGFVILMTLEKTKSATEFLKKRWLRLFPAMFLCSTLIFVTAPLLPHRPAGLPSSVDFLPGILFTEPSWLNHLFKLSSESLEGAFWSLYVEVRFYILSAFLYFHLNPKRYPSTLASIFILTMLVRSTDKISDWQEIEHASSLLKSMGFTFYGWFAAGAYLYQFKKTGNTANAWKASLMAALSSASQITTSVHHVIACLAVSMLFIGSEFSAIARRLLSNRILKWMGLISYPLYLIHENAMISLTISLESAAPSTPQILLPLAPIAILSLLSYLIAKHAEPWIRKLLGNWLDISNHPRPAR